MSKVARALLEQEREWDVSRVYVPIPLTEGFREAQSQIEDEDLYEDPHQVGISSFGKPSEPEVTVLFGLLTSDSDAVKRVSQSLDSINMKFADQTSVLSMGDYDVVKIAVYSEDLHVLNMSLRNSLPYEKGLPDYNPHVTVAFVKRGKGSKYAGIPVNLTEFDANKLVFSDAREEETKINLRTEVEETTTTAGLGGIPVGAVPGWQPLKKRKKRKTAADLANAMAKNDPLYPARILTRKITAQANVERPSSQ